MRPALFLSYVILSSQAFALIIFLPSFAARCTASTLDPSRCKSTRLVTQNGHNILQRRVHTHPNGTSASVSLVLAQTGGQDASESFKLEKNIDHAHHRKSTAFKVLASSIALVAVAALIPLQDALAAGGHAEPLTGFDRYWRIFLAGGVCASLSHAGAVPLDVVKTRLQTSPEVYKGILHAFTQIIQHEGAGMLFKGLGATVIGYSIQGSLKYGCYEIFKSVLHSLLPAQSIFVLWVLASVFADLIGSTALCPLEATRIRLVTDPTFARGTIDGMSRLVKTEGFVSIFKGMPAILAKQLPYTIVQLCGFELLTWLFYSWEGSAAILASPWQWGVSFASAMITGVVASLASQPGDAILSYVNKQKSEKNVLETMKECVKELGVSGLFRGTRARLLHVGTIVTIQLVIYDMVKQLCGLPVTGSH